MSQALIRAAFEQALNTWAAAQTPAVPVAWENVVYTPTAGARYARAFLLPARTTSDDLAGAHRHYEGVFQVSLVMPLGTGPAAAEALIASLDSAFPLTAPITSGSVKVFLLSPMSAAPALNEPDRFVVPVSCTYRADTI